MLISIVQSALASREVDIRPQSSISSWKYEWHPIVDLVACCISVVDLACIARSERHVSGSHVFVLCVCCN